MTSFKKIVNKFNIVAHSYKWLKNKVWAPC